MPGKINVLFVCMGNICRSPAGEAIFRHYVAEKELDSVIECDSAGTLREHAGSKADRRMIHAAKQRGFAITGRARQFQLADFDKFDLIITLDRGIHQKISNLARHDDDLIKVRLMGDFHPDEEIDDVPDPYYGSAQGFEFVLDILEIACERLLDQVIRDHPALAQRR